jgi:hypothetical protein
MKVRILSGSNAGAVVEMDQTVAEVNIATGYAVAVPDETPAPEVVVAVAEPEPEVVVGFAEPELEPEP